MTSPLEILLEQITNKDERQGYLNSFYIDKEVPVSKDVNKITLNLTEDEEAILFALSYLPPEIVGSNRSEIIRNLINIAFNHLVEQTYKLKIPLTDYSDKENEIFGASMGHYLHTAKISYSLENINADNQHRETYYDVAFYDFLKQTYQLELLTGQAVGRSLYTGDEVLEESLKNANEIRDMVSKIDTGENKE